MKLRDNRALAEECVFPVSSLPELAFIAVFVRAACGVSISPAANKKHTCLDLDYDGSSKLPRRFNVVLDYVLN